MLTQIETSKLSDKKIKEQLGQLKDREIEARLSNLRRNNNYNNNNNNSGGRPTGDVPGPPPRPASLGAPDEPFDPTTAPLLPPPRTDPTAAPYPSEIPPPPDSNTLFTERIAIADTDPNLRGSSTHSPIIGVIPRVSQVELSSPELLPEDQIRVSPSLRRTFPELSDEENENEHPQLEFIIPNFDEIRNTLNDGEIPPELEFFQWWTKPEILTNN